MAAEGVIVKGHVFLSHGFTVKGAVRLAGASIGVLAIDKATFDNCSKTAVSLESTVVIDLLSLKETRIAGFMILENCRVRRLVDDLESWPPAGNRH